MTVLWEHTAIRVRVSIYFPGMHSRTDAISLMLARDKLYGKMNFYFDARPEKTGSLKIILRRLYGSTQCVYPGVFFSIPRDSQSPAKLLIVIQNRFIKAYFLTRRDLFASTIPVAFRSWITGIQREVAGIPGLVIALLSLTAPGAFTSCFVRRDKNDR